MSGKLTHLSEDGEVHMVDVGGKEETSRRAVAEGCLVMRSETLEAILSGEAKKGDALAAARIAAIMAAKKTSELIPLCHPLPIDGIEAKIEPDMNLPGLRVRVSVSTRGRTGVEMEALTACSLACLTLYDMAKSMERGMEIRSVRLLSKEGGKSGKWGAEEN